jgi:hypothetical protein
MGMNYAFAFYMRRSQTDAALRAIASVAARDQKWLLKGIPYEPAATVSFLGRDGSERSIGLGVKGMNVSDPSPSPSKNYSCVSLLLPLDSKHWQDHWPWHPKPTLLGRTVVPVGCIYLSVYASEAFSIITLTAATTDMSLHFRDSAGTQDTMATISSQMGALVCILGMEGNEPDLIVGTGKRIDPVNLNCFEIENLTSVPPSGLYCFPDVDACATEVLRRCGIASGLI